MLLCKECVEILNCVSRLDMPDLEGWEVNGYRYVTIHFFDAFTQFINYRYINQYCNQQSLAEMHIH